MKYHSNALTSQKKPPLEGLAVNELISIGNNSVIQNSIEIIEGTSF